MKDRSVCDDILVLFAVSSNAKATPESNVCSTHCGNQVSGIAEMNKAGSEWRKVWRASSFWRQLVWYGMIWYGYQIYLD